jgi:hypothetical protein
VKELVSRRWAEYGLEADAAANGDGARTLRGLLRR